MAQASERPARPSAVEHDDFYRQLIDCYMYRYRVRPGITGWAQINGWRGNTSLEKRIEHDLYYIEHWSIGFDLKIILRTAFGGFTGRNAF